MNKCWEDCKGCKFILLPWIDEPCNTCYSNNKFTPREIIKPMKTIEINIPDGYEVDTEKSTQLSIVFKKIEKPVDPIESLPKSWETLGIIRGAHIANNCHIYVHSSLGSVPENINIWPTKELAEAALALCQLLQLRDRWNGDWKADYKDNSQEKFGINVTCESLTVKHGRIINNVMSFKSHTIRDKFLVTFKDLLETAKPLL